MYRLQVWNRFALHWQGTRYVDTRKEARDWHFEDPDNRRVLMDGQIVFQPRD